MPLDSGVSILKDISPEEDTTRVSQMKKVQEESLELFRKKNADYGDAFANYGVIGILVRMGDKINRLQSISSKKVSLINTESLRDTLIDLHNYAAMGIMLLDEDKNKIPRQTLPSPVLNSNEEREKTPNFQRCSSAPNNLNNLKNIITNNVDSMQGLDVLLM
tara:strand:+ start:1292 stop:1777 length:486 start_codon:yes stop_codon:yes gene_type:complete